MAYSTGGYGPADRGQMVGGLGLAGLALPGLAAAGRRFFGSVARRVFSRRGAQAAAVTGGIAAADIGMRRIPQMDVTLPGGAQFRPGALLPGGVPAFTPGECPKGMRKNKSSYFLKDGTFIAKGTKCVRYRRQNVANTRALKRATRRLTSFERLVKRERKALRKLSKI